MRFKIVDRYRYDLLEKMATRQEGYIEQIKINNKKLEELNQVIKMALLTLENQKKNLKIFSSRIGGLKASLKRKNTQNESLLTENNKLVEKISNVEKELEFKEQKIEFMKNSRKKVKNIEAYKNYFELRKELEKREKEKKESNDFMKNNSLIVRNNSQKIIAERIKYKVYCKCGHSMVIFPFEHKIKKLCSHCGNYVYVNEFEKFKEKLNESIKKKEALYEKCY